MVLMSVWLTVSAAHAQDAEPPVIDPATIFAEGVEVVETLPMLTYDNTARLLWYFAPETNQWQSFLYPDDLDQIQDSERRSDGAYLLSNTYYDGIAGALADKVWLFNPGEGAIERPQSVCNLVKALPGEGEWRLTQLEDGLYRLCNTETGQYSQPLPNDWQSQVQEVCTAWPAMLEGVPVTSPTGNWVVFQKCPYENEASPYTLYSYDVASDEFHTLGTSQSYADYFQIGNWIDDTHILIRDGLDMSDGYRNVNVGDITRANSLEYIATQFAYQPRYFDNPPRIMWVTTEPPYPSRMEARKTLLSVHEYDLRTHQSAVILERNCEHFGCDLVDIVWSEDQWIALWMGHPQHVTQAFEILDRQTGELLFEDVASDLYRLNEHIFLLDAYDEKTQSLLLKSIHIQNEQVVERLHPDGFLYNSGSVVPSLNGQDILIYEGYSSRMLSADVYNVDLQHRFTLTRPLTQDSVLDIRWLNGNLIHVDLLKKEVGSDSILGSWIVRIGEDQ